MIEPRRLYVAQFKNGVIKVGATSVRNHQREIGLRSVGGELASITYGSFHCGTRESEHELIVRMRRIARTLRGREWFTDVNYGAACTLLNQVTRRAMSRPTS